MSAIKIFNILILSALITPAWGQTTDYDTNDNGLIEIENLAQLNAIRWDLNGDGDVAAGDAANYLLAFPSRDSTDTGRMGCPTNLNADPYADCRGYELMNDLDFDTNGDGRTDSTGDTYYNGGEGWAPLGDISTSFFDTTFNGNGYTIANLFINRPSTGNIGLFGVVLSAAVIENLGLLNVDVTGSIRVGSLAGFTFSGSTIRACYATGTVTGSRDVGGLVGLLGGTLTVSYAQARVITNSPDAVPRVGGLVGTVASLGGGPITASYALGPVMGTSTNTTLGGLVGSGGTITASYWDTGTTGVIDDPDDNSPEGKTTAELQAPTAYTGIYAAWNIDVDGNTSTGDVTGRDNPWAFGTSSQYPVLRYGRRTRAQINAQFNLQTLATADVNLDGILDEQDAMLMYRTYLGVPVETLFSGRANAWKKRGQLVGGDLNQDEEINWQDALIMYYAYQFGTLLENNPALSRLLLNGLRGEQLLDTDTTYRELLRQANRLRR